jgi:hypothetical protein
MTDEKSIFVRRLTAAQGALGSFQEGELFELLEECKRRLQAPAEPVAQEPQPQEP